MHDFNAPLHSVEEAQTKILANVQPLGIEHVPLNAALNRVLASDIHADGDVPPFANSAMDGYAVQAADVLHATANQPVRLRIIERVAAGAMPQSAVIAGDASRIMTGAPLPAGADAVVPFEDTDEVQNPNNEHVQIFVAPQTGANIRPAGEDMRSGERVLSAGTLIHAGVIGVLATVGCASVPVFRRPRVAIMATGDELVDVDQVPVGGQIRNSNGYANMAQVLAAHAEPLMLPIVRDNEPAMLACLDQAQAMGADLLLTSGGVSVGDFDIVKYVLQTQGTLDFWRVRMRPGKPLAFGTIRGIPLIGLPGNPVSAMVCFELFARPMLLKMQGYQQVQRPMFTAQLRGATLKQADRRQYVRVIVQHEHGTLFATPTGNQGSGLITSMARANALLIVPEGDGMIADGATVQVMLLTEHRT